MRKRCTKCNKEYPEEEGFYVHSRDKKGKPIKYKAICIDCTKKYNKKYYEVNEEFLVEKAKEVKKKKKKNE